MTRVLTDAFHADGVWGAWAFPVAQSRRPNREAMFRIFVEGALRYPWTWLMPGDTAASVWIPPTGSDVSPEQEAALESLLLGSDAATDRILRAFELLEAARPSDPHYHLSLLGTDPLHAGHGHGQALLADNLAHLDAEGAAAYLDTADHLVALYERYGFRHVGSFVLPDGPRTNMMWRDPRPAADSAGPGDGHAQMAHVPGDRRDGHRAPRQRSTTRSARP